MTPALRHRFDEGVLTVTLDRPERRNALDRATRARMAELWDAHGQRRDLRCVVLCSTGLVFCAGADTHELASVPRPAVSEGPEPSLRHLPARALGVPVIAAVQGACTGLGLDLVADADLVVASPEAWFSDPHVSLGLVSAVGQLMLSSRVAPSALRRLVLLGRHYRMGATERGPAGWSTRSWRQATSNAWPPSGPPKSRRRRPPPPGAAWSSSGRCPVSTAATGWPRRGTARPPIGPIPTRAKVAEPTGNAGRRGGTLSNPGFTVAGAPLTGSYATLGEVLAAAADTFGDVPAIVMPGDVAPLSFAGWFDASRRLAYDLRQRGVDEGDVVALALPGGPDYAVGCGALALLGVVATGIHERLGAQEVSSIFEQCRPRLLLGEEVPVTRRTDPGHDQR